jgi:hypothetical protein
MTTDLTTTPPDDAPTSAADTPPEPTPGTPWYRRKRNQVIGSSVIAVLIIGAVVAIAIPKTFALEGSMILTGTEDDDWLTYGEDDAGCVGYGGYDDIVGPDTQVIVRDATATTVAVGGLDYGTPVSGTGCVFFFTVDGVPAGKDFYSVEISHRGELQYLEDELREGIVATLG